MGLKIHQGSFGVTGVKRSFLPKMLFLLQITCYGHGDSCILISYIPSTKVMGLEIQSGSFWVTGVKRSFSPKNAISPSDYMVWSLDSCIFISSIPSTKLRVYTTITRSIDFLYKLRSLLGALSRKKSWFAYINLVWFFSDECFLQHI